MYLLALSFSLAASAADDDLPEEEDDIDVPTTQQPTSSADEGWVKPTPKLTMDVDDDDTMHDFVADEKKKAPPPDWFHLDLTRKAPLADNFDIQIDAFNDQYVVVELPVLVATNRTTFAASHPGGLLVVAEVTSGPIRQVLSTQVTADMVLDAAPTLVFFKTALPNSAKTGDVRYLVKAAQLPAPPPVDPKAKAPPAPPAPATPKDLFARTTVFRRP